MLKEKFYQPVYKNNTTFQFITSYRFDMITESDFAEEYDYERVCLDRFMMMARDLYLFGPKHGATVLDLGCNIGFFCHSFQALGYKATGVENNIAQEVLEFSKRKPLDFAKELSERYKFHPTFIDADLIDTLKTCKATDVMLFLNILHHFFRGYASQGNVSLQIETVTELLKLVCSKVNRVMYMEINEHFAEEFGWGRQDIVHLVLECTDFKEMKPIGMTVGAGGDCRYVYRCEK